MLITDPHKRLGDLRPTNYNNDLLRLAQDLADRLCVAFRVRFSVSVPLPLFTFLVTRLLLFLSFSVKGNANWYSFS